MRECLVLLVAAVVVALFLLPEVEVEVVVAVPVAGEGGSFRTVSTPSRPPWRR
jgi:hypothetical protein